MSASRTAAARARAAKARDAKTRPAEAATCVGWRPQLSELAAGWGPTAARVLLGLVLAWFGYHELIQPAQWTGYVPAVGSASTAAVILVLAHGWLLLVLAVALVAGIWIRGTAGVASLLLAEIVIWLTATAGLSDLVIRDVGVLGLAVCLTGATKQRFILTR